jgi:hypothetical protein
MNVTRAKAVTVARVVETVTVVAGTMTKTEEVMTQVWLLAVAAMALAVDAGLYMPNPG